MVTTKTILTLCCFTQEQFHSVCAAVGFVMTAPDTFSQTAFAQNSEFWQSPDSESPDFPRTEARRQFVTWNRKHIIKRQQPVSRLLSRLPLQQVREQLGTEKLIHTCTCRPHKQGFRSAPEIAGNGWRVEPATADLHLHQNNDRLHTASGPLHQPDINSNLTSSLRI